MRMVPDSGFEAAARRDTAIAMAAGHETEPGPILQVFDHLPTGHLAFTVPDDGCEPLIRCGEIAVIDITDHEPAPGGLFLRKVGSAQYRSLAFRIEETIPHMSRTEIDGELGLHPAWYLGAHHRPHGAAEIEAWLRAGKSGTFVDGPYLHYGEKAWYLRDQLIGRVIGILGSAAHEMPIPASQTNMTP